MEALRPALWVMAGVAVLSLLQAAGLKGWNWKPWHWAALVIAPALLTFALGLHWLVATPPLGLSSLAQVRLVRQHSLLHGGPSVVLVAALVASMAGAVWGAGLLWALGTEGTQRQLRAAVQAAVALLWLQGVGIADRFIASLQTIVVPQIEPVDAALPMHVGRARAVAYRLVFPHQPEREAVPLPDALARAWEQPEVRVKADHAGSIPFAMTIKQGPVTVTAASAVHAAADEGSPLMHYAVGDTWQLERLDKSHDRVLFFIPSNHEQRRTLTFAVSAERDTEDGLRVHTLTRTDADGSTHATEFVNMDGKTLTYPLDQTELIAERPAADGAMLRSDQRPCHFAPLGECRCWLTPPDHARALPGPARCWSESGRSSSGVDTFVAIFTLGLIQHSSDHTSYVLLSSHAGAP